MVVSRFGVYLVSLDPVIGSEISKTRPCVVISPDVMNRHLRTLIVAPLTSAGKSYPTRVACRVQGKDGHVVLDQIRTVDRSRLIKPMGALEAEAASQVLRVLQKMFSQ